MAEDKLHEAVERGEPPMPSRVDVALTMREDGSHDGLPVVVLTMHDVTGDVRVVHLPDSVVQGLVGDLAVAHVQLAHGAKEMPAPWRR